MLQVHNTLTGKLEDFVPLHPPKVGMYVCGVTVYDRSHVGHARALVVFDVIYRYLRFLGYDVTFVRNFTDVDDKIIKRAPTRRGLSAERRGGVEHRRVQRGHGACSAARRRRSSRGPPSTSPR